MRIFTSDPKKYASVDELKAYDDLIASSQVPSNMGDIKPEDLSGPEALMNPGKLNSSLSNSLSLDAYVYNSKHANIFNSNENHIIIFTL